MKIVVFDLGGTLMQYVGMPHSWENFYYAGLEEIARKFKFSIPQETVEKSFQILKEFNPRMHHREIEYSADEIFRRDISELLGYFDYYVSSAIAGYRKPNCKGLQMISERFFVPITELIFVGDEEKDRKTAINAECMFIWIQRTARKEESIDNLYQLLKVLE